MAEIFIYLNQRKMHFYRDKSRFKEYPIAVGKPASPTPVGVWKVNTKIVNPGGILGTRWMGLNIPSTVGVYGIHGTSMPWSIGSAASLGCIRMFNQDIEEIFPLTPLGTKVEVIQTAGRMPGDKASGGRIYRVKKGDTLWAIARQYGIPLENLLAANKIDNPSQIPVGMELIIP